MPHFQMYAKSAFRTQEEHKRNKTFNDIDMVVQANYLEFLAFEKNEIKAQSYKQLLYRLGDINYLNESKVCKKYTETYSRPSVRKNTEELFHEMLPSDENKRNRLFLAPYFSPEIEIILENLHKPDAQIGLLSIDRIHNLVIESAGENSDSKKPTISVHSGYFKRQFFAAAVPVLKRYVASLTQEEVMEKIPSFLKNKHLSTFGTFINYVNMTEDKEVPYSTELVEEVLSHFRNPSHKYKTNNIFNKELIEFSIKQLEFSQEFLNKYPINPQNINIEQSVNTKNAHTEDLLKKHLTNLSLKKDIKETNINSLISTSLSDDNKQLLRDVLQIRQNLLEESDSLTTEEESFLLKLESQILETLDLNQLLDKNDNNEKILHTHIENIYNTTFKIEYDFLKNKSNKLLNTIETMETKLKVKSKTLR